MIQRSFVKTAAGMVHVAACGKGFPVLLLHQTPRSWDEYREVLPLIGRHAHAVAMDTPGFGDSDRLGEGAPSIEAWAGTALSLMDALGIQAACVVGHHTGAVIAMEVAARAPARVAALVLSSCPWVDAPRRVRHGDAVPVDDVVRAADGSHLGQLWAKRQPFYPPGDTALLDRFVADALKAGDMAVMGHRTVNRYHMEDRAPLVSAPTLVIGATADPHAFPSSRPVAAAIKGARVVDIEGGMVPLPDQMPHAFADAVLGFLRDQGCVT